MERKNTVLLTVIAVATLLVAVVGATFAYFTATNGGNTTVEESANTTTANVGSQNLDMTSVVAGGDMKYPGGILVAGVEVKGTVTGDNAYDMSYGIKGTVDVSDWETDENTTLSWTLYKSATKVSTSPVTDCTLDTGHLASNQYTYGDSCKLAQGISGTVVKSGTVTLGTSNEIKVTAAESADNLKLSNVSSNSAQTAYYYLVVTFDDAEMTSDQSNNKGKSITVSLSALENTDIKLVQ